MKDLKSLFVFAFYFLPFTFLSSCSHIVILHDPLSPEEHNDLGVSYEKNGELDLALREYRAALKKRSDFEIAKVNCANVLLKKKEYKESERLYLELIRNKTKDPDPYNNLAWLYAKEEKNLHFARGLIQEAIRLDPKREYLYLDTLGEILMKQKEFTKAKETLLKALSLTPEAENALHQEITKKLKDLESKFQEN